MIECTTIRRGNGIAPAIGILSAVYAATFYLTMLFGNFGGAEFIYFQF